MKGNRVMTDGEQRWELLFNKRLPCFSAFWVIDNLH